MVNYKKLIENKKSQKKLYESWYQILYINKKDKFKGKQKIIKI